MLPQISHLQPEDLPRDGNAKLRLVFNDPQSISIHFDNKIRLVSFWNNILNAELRSEFEHKNIRKQEQKQWNNNKPTGNNRIHRNKNERYVIRNSKSLYWKNRNIRDMSVTADSQVLTAVQCVWNLVGTRPRTGGEVKGKLANGVGIQVLWHYLGTWCNQHY